MNKFIFICLLEFVLPILCFANDTIANVATGNVTFKKSKDIGMESEMLTISPAKISVRYEFKNNSASPVEDTVAFPLPPSHSESGWGAEGLLKGENQLHFLLKVAGKDKPVKVNAKKTILSAKENIYEINSFYSWTQVFPAKKSIVVEHEYDTNPGSGGSATFSDEDKKKYCMDEAFLKAFEELKPKIQKLADKSAKSTNERSAELNNYLHYHSFSRVSYILTTASNWAGPIKDFQLRIKKDKPSTLVSLCWDGLKKISVLEFESKKQNFSPNADLDILFVHER